MALELVIANEALGSRAVIDPSSLPDLEVRGWVAVGRTSVPSRAVTDDEQAAADAAEAARVAALLKPGKASASPQPSK